MNPQEIESSIVYLRDESAEHYESFQAVWCFIVATVVLTALGFISVLTYLDV